VALALKGAKLDGAATVFAGQDTDATQQARGYFPELPPSSPSIILLRDGKLLDYIPRHRIERRPAQDIAQDITAAVSK
jgi:putative YphP/YqiW family bacilliredoxin